MFRIESVEEAEQPDDDDDVEGDYVHVVTANLFDIARVFADPYIAMDYALHIFKAFDQTPLLMRAMYLDEYRNRHRITISAADRKSMITVTVRKLRIRNDRCYTLGNE